MWLHYIDCIVLTWKCLVSNFDFECQILNRIAAEVIVEPKPPMVSCLRYFGVEVCSMNGIVFSYKRCQVFGDSFGYLETVQAWEIMWCVR